MATLGLTACGGGGDTTGGSVDDWCAVAQQIADLEAANPDMLDIERASSATLGEYRSLIDDAAAVAPDVVLTDANAMADGVDQFVNVAESVGYDFDALTEDELLDTLGEVLAIAEPIERLQLFNQSECGITSVARIDGGDDPEIATSTSAAPTTTIASTTILTTTTEPPADQVRFTGDADSEWCVVSRELSLIQAEFESLLFGDPDEVESAMSQMIETNEAAVAAAPPEVADAAALSLEGLRLFDQAFADADYALLDADLSVLAGTDDELVVANDLIRRYNVDVCGFTPSTFEVEVGDNDFDPTVGSIREQMILLFVDQGLTEEEATCIIGRLDLSDLDAIDDPAVLAEVLTACGIDFDRLTELGSL